MMFHMEIKDLLITVKQVHMRKKKFFFLTFVCHVVFKFQHAFMLRLGLLLQYQKTIARVS